MNRYLEAGYQFHVSERAGVFTVCELIGKGASCAVYRADFTDEHGNQTQHLLKEYHPSRMEMDREDSGALVPEDEKKFREGLRRFHSCYEKQLQIRRISGLKNTTSNIQGIYHANGTQYIDMTCFQGQTYDKLREQSVYDLMRRMRALTSVIDNYHKAGFLHLDIKPSNIYTIPETCEMVMLFDFDSVVEKENILSGGGLSYSKAWAAPEQFLPGYEKNICEATDLFAVGEIIFFALFGRHSSRTERRSFAEYSFDYEADIFQNMNPRVFPLLGDLLRHTICSVPYKRYQTAEKLRTQLTKIVEVLSSDQPYLISNIHPNANKSVVGNKTVEKIHHKLQYCGRYFLKSTESRDMSGYAEKYINTYGYDYEVIISLDCQYGLINMVDGSIPESREKTIFGNLKNFSLCQTNSKIDFEQIFDVLDSLCDNKVLLVINNFHEGYIVDDSYFDIAQIQWLCERFEMSSAAILLNGSFNIGNFRLNKHYRYLHDLLIGLARINCKNARLDRAEECVKNAIHIASQCNSYIMTKAFIEDQKYLDQIRADQVILDRHGMNDDENALDEFLEFFSDCIDDI